MLIDYFSFRAEYIVKILKTKIHGLPEKNRDEDFVSLGLMYLFYEFHHRNVCKANEISRTYDDREIQCFKHLPCNRLHIKHTSMVRLEKCVSWFRRFKISE